MNDHSEHKSLERGAEASSREALRERLLFLGDTLETRWITQRASDDSARPAFEVVIPTRELDSTIQSLREAAAALPAPQGEEARGQTVNEKAERLRGFVRAWLPGGCKMLSRGPDCICPLCDIDNLERFAVQPTGEDDPQTPEPYPPFEGTEVMSGDEDRS